MGEADEGPVSRAEYLSLLARVEGLQARLSGLEDVVRRLHEGVLFQLGQLEKR